VKDALDHDARKIDLSPRDSTIAYLTALPAPPTPSGRYDMRGMRPSRRPCIEYRQHSRA